MLEENYEAGMFDGGMRLGRVTYYNKDRGFGFLQDLGLSGKEKMGIRFFHTGRHGYCKPEVAKDGLSHYRIMYIVPNSGQIYPKVGDSVVFWNDPISPDWGKVHTRCVTLANDHSLATEKLKSLKG